MTEVLCPGEPGFPGVPAVQQGDARENYGGEGRATES